MRVIHLIGGGDTGGAKTHVLHLLKKLNDSIDAQLVCFRKGDFSEDAAKMSIPIHVIDTGNPLLGLKELKKLTAGQKIDIIHCHGARGNLMGNLLKHSVKAPVVTTVHSDYRLDYLGRPVARLSYGTTNLVALRRLNYYIGVSDPMRELLIDRGFPADRIYTIYNGIDFKTPLQFQPKEAFLTQLGLSYEPGDVVAGIVARLDPVKDHPTLLRAMKIACQRCPRLKLVCAGDGDTLKKLQDLTQSLGLEGRVCFAGWVNDIPSFYNAIDINLLTSLSETFPYALTDGTRSHLATIASRVGGVPVLIDHGVNGLLFTPGDEQELARHLIALAEDPELRQTLGNRLYEKASKKLSLESMVDCQLEIYESILKREQRKQSRPGRDGVVVCGAYGYGNAGDDAILKSIIQSVRQSDEYLPVTVLAKNTNSIKKRFGVHSIYTFNLPRIARCMRRSQLYINGGGTLIQNATSHRSLWYYLFTLWLAKRLGNHVDMYGCGIGPVRGRHNQRLVRRVLNRSVDVITLREPDSMTELASYGVDRPKVRLSSDPALILPQADPAQAERFLRDQGVEPGGRYICFLLRNWRGFEGKAEIFARCAQQARDKLGLEPVFLPINSFQDPAAAKEVLSHMERPGLSLTGAGPELLISVLAKMEVVVSMRLHGLIFSSLSGAPLVGVSYDPKIGSYLRYLGYGQWTELGDLTEDWLNQSIAAAAAQTGRREEFKAMTARLLEVERENLAAAEELLKG